MNTQEGPSHHHHRKDLIGYEYNDLNAFRGSNPMMASGNATNVKSVEEAFKGLDISNVQVYIFYPILTSLYLYVTSLSLSLSLVIIIITMIIYYHHIIIYTYRIYLMSYMGMILMRLFIP